MSDTYTVELLDAAGARVGEPVNVVELATSFAEALVGRPLGVARVALLLYRQPAAPDPGLFDLPPSLSPDWGWARLLVYTIAANEELNMLYRHPHPLDEILAPGLRARLASLPAASAVVAWRLCGPSVDTSRPVPAVQGLARELPLGPDEPRPFRLRRVPPPPPPLARAADFGAEPLPEGWASDTRSDRVHVLLDAALAQDLEERRWDPDAEEGGFLLGRVYTDADAPARYLVHLTAAPAARATGASTLSFTFTGDSFVALAEDLAARRSGEERVGWYHTHLFEGAGDLGLSSIDDRLHRETFRLPWQLAGLVNLGRDGRLLRFYVRESGSMRLCRHDLVTRGPDAGP